MTAFRIGDKVRMTYQYSDFLGQTGRVVSIKNLSVGIRYERHNNLMVYSIGGPYAKSLKLLGREDIKSIPLKTIVLRGGVKREEKDV